MNERPVSLAKVKPWCLWRSDYLVDTSFEAHDFQSLPFPWNFSYHSFSLKAIQRDQLKAECLVSWVRGQKMWQLKEKDKRAEWQRGYRKKRMCPKDICSPGKQQARVAGLLLTSPPSPPFCSGHAPVPRYLQRVLWSQPFLAVVRWRWSLFGVAGEVGRDEHFYKTFRLLHERC